MLSTVDWFLQTFRDNLSVPYSRVELWWTAWPLNMRPIVFSRNVGDYIVRCVQWTARALKMGPMGYTETSFAVSLRCVTSQKGEDLVCIVAEAFNRAFYLFADLWICLCGNEQQKPATSTAHNVADSLQHIAVMTSITCILHDWHPWSLRPSCETNSCVVIMRASNLCFFSFVSASPKRSSLAKVIWKHAWGGYLECHKERASLPSRFCIFSQSKKMPTSYGIRLTHIVPTSRAGFTEVLISP